ncbi:MAG: hypothetical protein Q9174_000855 [Haloplaca sp. 1 TL-2023]
MLNGSKMAALRFRAENAHRMPTTPTGWYQYHKSKHYNVALEAMKSGMRFGLRLPVWALGFIVIEDSVDRLRGMRDAFSTVVAGLTLSGIFSVKNGFNIPTAARTARAGLWGGLMFGVLQDVMALARGRHVPYVDLLKRVMDMKGYEWSRVLLIRIIDESGTHRHYSCRHEYDEEEYVNYAAEDSQGSEFEEPPKRSSRKQKSLRNRRDADDDEDDEDDDFTSRRGKQVAIAPKKSNKEVRRRRQTEETDEESEEPDSSEEDRKLKKREKKRSQKRGKEEIVIKAWEKCPKEQIDDAFIELVAHVTDMDISKIAKIAEKHLERHTQTGEYNLDGLYHSRKIAPDDVKKLKKDIRERKKSADRSRSGVLYCTAITKDVILDDFDYRPPPRRPGYGPGYYSGYGDKQVCAVKTRSYIVSASATLAANLTSSDGGPLTNADFRNSTQVANQIFQLQLVAPAVGNLRPRQDDALGFLDSNGDVVQLCQSAPIYVVQNGQLLSGPLSFSTFRGVSNSPFSASEEQGFIDTTFSVADGYLTWESDAFEGGAARFYFKLSQPILAVFAGPAPEGYTAVSLRNTPRKHSWVPVSGPHSCAHCHLPSLRVCRLSLYRADFLAFHRHFYSQQYVLAECLEFNWTSEQHQPSYKLFAVLYTVYCSLYPVKQSNFNKYGHIFWQPIPQFNAKHVVELQFSGVDLQFSSVHLQSSGVQLDGSSQHCKLLDTGQQVARFLFQLLRIYSLFGNIVDTSACYNYICYHSNAR